MKNKQIKFSEFSRNSKYMIQILNIHNIVFYHLIEKSYTTKLLNVDIHDSKDDCVY